MCAAAASGCAPQIGDGCSTATNCSINGDRLCDVAQPGGYCTIFDCQPDRCPDNALCVRFNPQPARRAIVACMRRCGGDGDCRGEYRCATPEDLATMGLDVEVTDVGRGQSFCVARADVAPLPDAGPGVDSGPEPEIDAGATDDAGSDAGATDDAGSDAGPDPDAGADAATADDAGSDAGPAADAAPDAT